jgi:hypothetical protein
LKSEFSARTGLFSKAKQHLRGAQLAAQALVIAQLGDW